LRSWALSAAYLRRLNHILVPATKAERDRFRRARPFRLLRGLSILYERFSEDGQLLVTCTAVASLLALDLKRSDVYLAWATLAGLLFASWVASFFFRLHHVELDVSVPRRVTVGAEAVFTLAIRNAGTHLHESVAARGPFLPWDGSWLQRRTGLAALAPGNTAYLELAARFMARGEHHLDPFQVRAMVPFGLAFGPALRTHGVRFLVVPRIANVVSLSLPRGRRHNPGGVPRAAHTADSRELLGVRPYRFGDPIRDLHARTWARVGEPVVREYREEYFARIGIVLDTEQGMGAESDFEAAISLVAGIIARSSQGESLVELIVLGKTMHTATLGRSTGTLDQALELLACVEPEAAFDGDAVSALVIPRLPRLSCLVFVALRWDDARRTFAEGVSAMGTACSSLVVTDAELPAGDFTAVAPKAIHAGAPLPL
jgi:uncharacterized protein (DUF58 family)